MERSEGSELENELLEGVSKAMGFCTIGPVDAAAVPVCLMNALHENRWMSMLVLSSNYGNNRGNNKRKWAIYYITFVFLLNSRIVY